MTVSRGVDSNADVHPILVDANGRPYVIVDDGAGNTQPALDSMARRGYVQICDGGNVANVTGSSALQVYVSELYTDGTNRMPAGDAAARAICVQLSDGVNPVEVDPDIGGLLVTPIERNLVGDGVVFSCFHTFGAVPAATSRWLHVKVPASYVAHMRFRFMAEAKIDYYVYENPTLTGDGTALTEFDMNRTTSNASNVDVFHTPTVSAVGTMIDNGMLGSSGFLTDTGGSISPMRDWIFKESESYLVGANNNDAAAKDIVIQLSWYEEEV